MAPKFSPPLLGLIILSINPLAMSFGAFIADFNETHVLNPTWPPHARFHNGQTMSMSVFLCVATLFFVWRTRSLPTFARQKDSLLAALIIGSAYTVTGLSAEWYPGSHCVDKMFWNDGVDPGCPQHYIFGIPLLIHWIGFAVSRLGMQSETATGKKSI